MDWKSILGTLAPTVATAIGGPFGGIAAKVALSALGIDSPPEDAEAALEAQIRQADPDMLLKLRTAENQFKLDMERLGVDLEKVHAGDRASARDREVKTRDNAPKILATVVVLGFFATLATIAFATIPAAAMDAVQILLGALTALLIQVGNYYFGSSAGSAAKNATIHKALNQ